MRANTAPLPVLFLFLVVANLSFELRIAAETPAAPDPVVVEALKIIDSDLYTLPATAQWQEVRQHLLSTHFSNSEERASALRELLRLAPDPNTRLMEAGDFAILQKEFAREAANTGITDLAVHRADGGKLVVTTPIVGSPAFHAGLRPLDVIESIEGSPTIGLDRAEVMRRLRGPAGTSVKVGVARGTKHLTLELVREVNAFPPVYSDLRHYQGKSYAFIAINEFSPSTAALARSAVSDLLKRGASGFLLDLRHNPGGLLDSASSVAGIFVNAGAFCEIHRRNGHVEPVKLVPPLLTDKPLVALVDGSTVSAAEILAATLQTSHRAKLVGTKSFGQGLVFVVRELNDKSLLVLASGSLGPSGSEPLQGKGVTPDVEVHLRHDRPLLPEQITPQNDEPYAQGLALLAQAAAYIPPSSAEGP